MKAIFGSLTFTVLIVYVFAEEDEAVHMCGMDSNGDLESGCECHDKTVDCDDVKLLLSLLVF